MTLRLRTFFIATAVVAVWLWVHRDPSIPLGAIARYTPVVFTVLAVFGCSWMTLTSLAASLGSLFAFETCACGHVLTWNAIPVTALSCAVGWWGAWHARQGGRASRMVAICVAVAATSICIKILDDLIVSGHRPIWPDSPIAGSFHL